MSMLNMKRYCPSQVTKEMKIKVMKYFHLSDWQIPKKIAITQGWQVSRKRHSHIL